MSTPDGRFTLIFNGEIYNHLELRKELRDVAFKSRSDTEVVLHAYVRWGASCLERLVGMFSLAIWDKMEQELFCARDRFGIKPFYYALKGDTFLFSSEIKGLLAAGVPGEVNERVVYDFLSRDYYDHSEESFFKGIFKLPPGHLMRWKSGRIQPPQRYWSLACASSISVM